MLLSSMRPRPRLNAEESALPGLHDDLHDRLAEAQAAVQAGWPDTVPTDVRGAAMAQASNPEQVPAAPAVTPIAPTADVPAPAVEIAAESASAPEDPPPVAAINQPASEPVAQCQRETASGPAPPRVASPAATIEPDGAEVLAAYLLELAATLAVMRQALQDLSPPPAGFDLEVPALPPLPEAWMLG